MLAVSIVEAGREAAALMLGMMWARWRQAHQSLSSPLSGAMENQSCLGNLSLVDSLTPEGENFDVGIDVLFVEILIFVVGVNGSSQAALPARMRAKGGERESTARIALQRKGAGKKLLRASRLMTLTALSVGRADKSSTTRQALMSSMVGTISPGWRVTLPRGRQ